MTTDAPNSTDLFKSAVDAPGEGVESVPITDPDFVDHVFAYLLKEFPHLAGPEFARAERAVRDLWGGERAYVRGDKKQALAHQVLSLFNGANATAVARELNISRATVYRLLKQASQN